MKKVEKIRILNADLDNISMKELVEEFDEGLMLTLHVDMIMKLQKDKDFYDLLPEFDVITCDSQILYFASVLLGTPFKERVSGSDFFPYYYTHHRNNPDVTIFLCGGVPGIAELAREKINAKVGREIIVGTYSPPFDYDSIPGEVDNMIEKINASKASALLVGLGGARQEKFMIQNRDRFTHAKIFLPLGGTIDYEAGVFKRPPAWITTFGLEWLYRLAIEPKQRWRRYIVHQPPVLYHLLKQRLGLYKDPFSGS